MSVSVFFVVFFLRNYSASHSTYVMEMKCQGIKNVIEMLCFTISKVILM